MHKLLTATFAGAIGLVPTLMLASPAHAVPAPVGSANQVTMADASAIEGSNIVFTLNHVGNASAAATYTITAADVTATGGGTDYTAPTPTSVTFPAGTGTQTASITVATTDDTLYENAETFTITAQNVGVTNDWATATGTINDNDTAPSYTLTSADSPVNENVSGGYAHVTATLSTASGVNTTVTLTTADGTAKSTTNYGSTITPITIPAGSTTGTAQVSVVNDGLHDAVSPMTFTVNGVADNVLSSGRNKSVQLGINDVQAVPKLTLVGPATKAEGQTASYTVNSDQASTQAVTVDWAALPTTAQPGHGVATPGDDFTYPSTGRTVTIPAGSTSATISVPITSDGLNELPEDYTIGLSNPTNAVLNTTTKVVTTITSADPLPTVSILPTTVTEGDSGNRTQTFTATLSAKSGRDISVDWNTADGSAMKGYDYVASSGTITFPAGTTTQTFTVDIIGDTIYEPGNETFTIQQNVPAADVSVPTFTPTANTTITITDDDPMPTITVADMSVKEGDVTTPVLVPFKLSNPTNQTVTLGITAAPDATNGASSAFSSTVGSGDYSLLTAAPTIAPGQLYGYGVVLVNGDTIFEPDETADLTWSASNVTDPGPSVEKFTILNDDKAPTLDINDVTGTPGDTADVTGTVSGMSQTATTVTVTFAGQAFGGKTAASASDFVNPGGVTVSIPIGTAAGVVLPVTSLQLNDTDYTTDRTIVASGVGNNGVGTVVPGVVTIKGSSTTTPPGGGTTPPAATAPTISVPSTITGAGTVRVTGTATAGASVDIWGGPWTSDMPALTKLGSVTAGSTGAYSYSKAITSGYRFKAAVGDKTSAEVKTGVTQIPLFIASSPSKGLVSLAVQGNPRGVGQGLVIQRWTGSGWVTGWTGKTGSDNLWKSTIKEPSKSVWTLRAYVAGNSGMGLYPGYSASVKVTVK